MPRCPAPAGHRLKPAGMADSDDWGAHLSTVGAFIREQRRLVKLSQRQLAKATGLSDTYLSQLERGMHEPSLRALRAIAKGLNVSADQLISLTGALADDLEERGDGTPVEPEAARPLGTEDAIRADARLTEAQKSALLAVLGSYLVANAVDEDGAGRAGRSGRPSGGSGDGAGRPRRGSR